MTIVPSFTEIGLLESGLTYATGSVVILSGGG